MAFPKVGNLAPAFTLLDQDGNKVSLKQFRDKKNVVLYFYPKAMTPGCTVQACGIRDSKKALAKLDTVVLVFFLLACFAPIVIPNLLSQFRSLFLVGRIAGFILFLYPLLRTHSAFRLGTGGTAPSGRNARSFSVQ